MQKPGESDGELHLPREKKDWAEKQSGSERQTEREIVIDLEIRKSHRDTERQPESEKE